MIQENYPRPVPTWDHFEFWAACKRHEFRLQRCSDCGAYRHQPRAYCPDCRSRSFDWPLVSGHGSVYSYTISYPPVLPAFEAKAPFNAIVVELDEGPFMVSNLVDWPVDVEIPIGLPVEIVFTDIDEELTIPQFRAIPAE
jgi:uncharacterized OB-fold protein